jgi:hypothetical protein
MGSVALMCINRCIDWYDVNSQKFRVSISVFGLFSSGVFEQCLIQ